MLPEGEGESMTALKKRPECEGVHICFYRFMFHSAREIREPRMKCDYDGFKIESFEAGKGLWHARFRRADLTPVIIDGVLFSALEVGFAWSDPDAALADAKVQIDHLNQRGDAAGQRPQAELSAAL
jgi:hypothetical protein